MYEEKKVKGTKKTIILLITALWCLAGSACREPTIDERWESSFEELVRESTALDPVAQLYLARKILSERAEDFQNFCAYQHSEEVEFECNNILKRPHLLNQKKT